VRGKALVRGGAPHMREDESDPTAERRRRWYHIRPEPRRRTDLMGFNSVWWMLVVWLVVIVVAVFPFPWWW
jgi:hypothetical protein